MPEKPATAPATAEAIEPGVLAMGLPHHLLLARFRLDADGRDWLLWLRQRGNELMVSVTEADGRALPGWWGRDLPPCFAGPDDASSIRAVSEWLQALKGGPRVVGIDVERPEPPAKGRR